MSAKNEHGLTPAQEAFARGVTAGLSQAEAYRQAYPKSRKWKAEAVHQSGSRLIALPHVSARVAVLQAAAADQAELDGAEILRELKRIAVSDIAGIMSPDGKRVRLPHELDPSTRSAVKAFKIDEFGRIEYQFWDKNAAIDKAMKHLGLFERDNEQKTDPLSELLKKLGGNVIGPGRGVPPPDGDDED